MPQTALKVQAEPRLKQARMVLAFTGWMDGGEVSTGTVDCLAKAAHAPAIAHLEPEGFCIYNLPGPMELAALCRPHTRINDGLIESLECPANTFLCDQPNNLVLFTGREPNLNWGPFAKCILNFAERLGVSVLYFVGSYAGMVPHTRAPRLTTTVSDRQLRPELEKWGVSFANYEGPASFATYLIAQAPTHGLQMASLVAEIPAYIQGPNPKCIEAVVRKLAAILSLQIDLDNLRKLSDRWEQRVNHAVRRNAELAALITKLEESYDKELFDTQMGDLKDWLERQGIRVD